MKMIYTIAAVLLAANVAVAQNDNSISEFHQHAMMGQLEVTPEIAYRSATLDNGVADVDASGFRLGSEVEYGVMERLSVGANLFYNSITTDGTPETTSSGLEDIVLFARGSNAMTSGRLAYGADLGVSLGNAETEANGDTNAMTGGMSLKPYIGYELMAGAGVWGVQANYTWLGETTDESAGVETKSEGGGGLGLATFYEHPVSATTTIGAALTYGMMGETETAGTKNGDDHTDLGIKIYAPINAGTNMTVIPKLSWTKMDYDGPVSVSVLDVGAALRMGF